VSLPGGVLRVSTRREPPLDPASRAPTFVTKRRPA
jgi:hypothetical protein